MSLYAYDLDQTFKNVRGDEEFRRDHERSVKSFDFSENWRGEGSCDAC